jgi:hypothetical protein
MDSKIEIKKQLIVYLDRVHVYNKWPFVGNP